MKDGVMKEIKDRAHFIKTLYEKKRGKKRVY